MHFALFVIIQSQTAPARKSTPSQAKFTKISIQPSNQGRLLASLHKALNLRSSNWIELLLLLSLQWGPYFPRAVKVVKNLNRQWFFPSQSECRIWVTALSLASPSLNLTSRQKPTKTVECGVRLICWNGWSKQKSRKMRASLQDLLHLQTNRKWLRGRKFLQSWLEETFI